MPTGNELNIIGNILDSQYQQDLATSPYLMGAKILPQSLVVQPGQSALSAGASGLGLGLAQGFLTRFGVNQAQDEKRDYEDAMIKYLGTTDPTARQTLIDERTLPAGFAAKMALAEALDQQDLAKNSITAADAAALGLPDNLVGRPIQVANLVAAQNKLATWTDPDLKAKLAAAAAAGGLSGKQGFNVEQGVLPQNAIDARKVADAAIAKAPITKTYQSMLSYAEQLKALVNQNSPLADDAMITAFVKIEDPNSVAREGEVARVMRARDYLSQAIGAYNKKIMGGSSFSPEEKKNLINAIDVIQGAAANKYFDVVQNAVKSTVRTGGVAALAGWYPPVIPPQYKDEVEGWNGIGSSYMDALQKGDIDTAKKISLTTLDLISSGGFTNANPTSSAPAAGSQSVKWIDGKIYQIPAGLSRDQAKAYMLQHFGK